MIQYMYTSCRQCTSNCCNSIILQQLLTKEVEDELREEAAEVLAGSGESIDEASINAVVPEANLPVIHARLVNLTKLTQLKNLKAKYYGKNLSSIYIKGLFLIMYKSSLITEKN